MSDSKHTPAPWVQEGQLVYALNKQGENRFSASIQGGWVWRNSSPVGHSRSPGERTLNDELEANARLMAAAPDLLAAAKRVVAKLQHPTASVTILDQEALELAIAKAEGATK